MAAPLGKATRMPTAHRPWLDSPSEGEPYCRESPKMIRERETCLNCELPECPSAQCPISTKDINTAMTKPGRAPKQPPAGVREWAAKPITNKVLAEQYGVGVKIIRRWWKELGHSRREKSRP